MQKIYFRFNLSSQHFCSFVFIHIIFFSILTYYFINTPNIDKQSINFSHYFVKLQGDIVYATK